MPEAVVMSCASLSAVSNWPISSSSNFMQRLHEGAVDALSLPGLAELRADFGPDFFLQSWPRSLFSTNSSIMYARTSCVPSGGTRIGNWISLSK